MKKKSAFPILYPNAAGIDIASKEHFVAVNPSVTDKPIRAFGSFTEDLFEIIMVIPMQSRYRGYGGHWYLLGKPLSNPRRSWV